MLAKRPFSSLPGWPPYAWVIGTLWLLLISLYLVHLSTGWTPDRVAFDIPGFNLPVYWYGICIVGGIALGAWVIAEIAEQRATAVFQNSIPQTVRERPLDSTPLSPSIQEQLTDAGVNTLGELLWRWHISPASLKLARGQMEPVAQQLSEDPDLTPALLQDAPWRQWNPDHIWNGLMLCIILGVIGARLYHVLTPPPSMAAIGIESPLDYFRNPYQLFNLRNGGLGIYGGLAGGLLGLLIYTRRQKLSLLAWSDLAAIAVALGQAIGRWGNFFNQELYGRPTSLPWAVHIDSAYRLPGFESVARFHPAFLYEALWNLATFLLLYRLATRYASRVRPGELTAVYLIAYAIGRTLLEFVRLDSRTVQLGFVDIQIAIATLVSLIVAILMAGWMIHQRVR